MQQKLGPIEDFLERNLNDTRYFGRLLKNHIETNLVNDLGKPVRVVCISGQATAMLRARWGLIKDRSAGDKHHALDAAVVAATSRKLVQRITSFSKRKELKKVHLNDFVDFETGEVFDPSQLERLEKNFPLPYPDFSRELTARLSETPRDGLQLIEFYKLNSEKLAQIRPIIVSRAPRRLGTGAAHEGRARSTKKDPTNADSKAVFLNTPLTDITLGKLEQIKGYNDPRNSAFIEALRDRLNEYDNKPEKAFAEDRPFFKPTKPGKKAPQVFTVKLGDSKMATGLPLRKKSGLAKNGDMVRVDVYRLEEKFVGVPVYVHQLGKGRPRKLPVSKSPISEWPELSNEAIFKFSLYPNTFVRIEKRNHEKVEGYFRSYDIKTKSICLASHDRNPNVGKDGEFRGLGIATLKTFEPLHVSVLGDIFHSRNDKKRLR